MSDVQRIALIWFAVALLIRLAAALALHYYSLAKGYGGYYPLASGNDDRFYWDIAVHIYNSEPTNNIFYPYPYVLATMFYLFGQSIIAAKLLNVLIGALTVLIGIFICGRLINNTDSRLRTRCFHLAGIFLTFYPAAIFYSTQLVKDPLTVLMGIFNLYLGVRLLEKPRLIELLLWILTFSGVYLFRFYAGLALGLSLFVLAIRHRRTWGVATVVFGAVAIVPYLDGFGWFSWEHLRAFATGQKMSDFREGSYSVGGSSIGLKINYQNPIMFLLTYIYSFLIVLFGPFPWHIRSKTVLVAVPETVLMWALIPIWLKGFINFFKQTVNGKHLLFLYINVLIGVVAFFGDNIGANTRLRLLPWGALLLYSALTIAATKRWLYKDKVKAKGETI